MKRSKSMMVITFFVIAQFLTINVQNSFSQDPIPYHYLREADIMWSKRVWRKIDLKEKFNHPLYYPIERTADRISLVQLLIDGVREGALTAYDPADDEFTTILDPMRRKRLLNRIDTIEVPDTEPPYDIIRKPVERPFDPSSVKEIRVKEEWYFDRQRSKMEVRTLGICLVYENMDYTTGTIRGSTPMFWIYFPEARPLLASAKAYNPSDNRVRINYDDIFLKRFFQSYVYKEENVYNREIQDYTTGLGALYEAEKVKENIFNFEHDLWNY